jgi:hypothetical protein
MRPKAETRIHLAQLAMVLARAYLRRGNKTRRDAVSCAAAEQISLGAFGPKSPDERVVRDVRRAG